MKLSTKGQYGVKAMFDLALHYGGDEPISLKGIAERQGISEYYLEQLMAVLRRQKLVKSVRGAQGGYVLSKDPSLITVGQILSVLEGPVEISDCITDDENIECSRVHYCPTRLIWVKIKTAINDVVSSITLSDMVNDYKELKEINKHLIAKEN
ncbi:HTH-type transcriptional regulator CymR [Oxobacter pfennigii]|uniref:HTH-type transcriptional regulator CymR n=1 Tax=Oxobacter pfennigii TaxID=36849 RepID=A0A0P9AHL6_9CLOT|nr:Rrf2 family transcriptional regulator [Oxobacter pfennigii]KPU44961.1 HTH-type transcriptional regulator CymR [Oxobacter pfennigii]